MEYYKVIALSCSGRGRKIHRAGESFDFYDVMWGDGAGGDVSEATFAEMINEVRDHLLNLEQKIRRSYELQACQTLFDGIVQLKSAENIDFRRKAGSLVAYNVAHDFAVGTVDPTVILEQGCNFIRQEGKSGAGQYNVIMAGDVYRAMINNDTFKENADVRRIRQTELDMPQRNAEGAVFHGVISTGSYELFVWTYPQFYTDPDTEISTPYTPDKKLTIIPLAPRFVQGFAGVPHIMRDETQAEFNEFIQMRRGAFHIDNYIDQKGYSHLYRVRSAGITIPVAVDTIFTVQVLAP